MIKTEIHGKKSDWELTYPILMRSKLNGAVVLFTSVRTGTVLASGVSLDKVGEYSETWISANDTMNWEPLDFKITLSNE